LERATIFDPHSGCTIESEWVDDTTCRWRVSDPERGTLAFEAVLSAWRSDEGFRSTWISGLKAIPFNAYCWECPPVHETNLGRTFECVMIASPSLTRMGTDPDAFAEHFRPGCDAVTFGNLGGDAVLVVPCPLGANSAYGHLAQFVRAASHAQQHSLWKSVAAAMQARLGTKPVWLSTAGHGVAWLHVRLDSSPKYYRHREYTKA
jgi:hypothetical protein